MEFKKQISCLFRALVDLRVYFLIVPFALLFAYFSPTVGETLGEWLVGFPVLVGFALLIRKILFHIDMHDTLVKACETSQGAAMVILSMAITMSAVIVSGVVWLVS